MIPICVITYNHPKYDLIDRIKRKNLFIKNPVYYFIYDKDWDLYDFKAYQYNFKEIHYIKVPYPEYKTAERNRFFVQNHMKNFDKFWFFDNDIGTSFQYKNKEEGKVQSTDLFSKLEELEKIEEINDYGLIGFVQDWHELLHETKEIIKEGYAMNLILVNNKKLKENNIGYTGDPDVAEDFELMLLCKLKGIKVGKFTKYKYTTVCPTNSNSWYNVDKLVTCTYNKYKDTSLLKMTTNRKGALKLHILKEPDPKKDLW